MIKGKLIITIIIASLSIFAGLKLFAVPSRDVDPRAASSPRYHVIASSNRFLRVDSWTGRAWLMTPEPTLARWLPVMEPDEQFIESK